jgi:hypothetical protein
MISDSEIRGGWPPGKVVAYGASRVEATGELAERGAQSSCAKAAVDPKGKYPPPRRCAMYAVSRALARHKKLAPTRD